MPASAMSFAPFAARPQAHAMTMALPPSAEPQLVQINTGFTGSFSLLLSNNASTGGTCFGDSGGPHFLGGTASNLQVSLTVTGDSACRATDKTYRLDTPSAREFLGPFVTLP